jgi:hypothetical protein
MNITLILDTYKLSYLNKQRHSINFILFRFILTNIIPQKPSKIFKFPKKLPNITVISSLRYTNLCKSPSFIIPINLKGLK